MRARRLALAGLVLLALAATAALLFDANLLRGPISHIVSQRLDRRFVINGDLHLGYDHGLVVEAEDVALADAAWSGATPMFHAGRARLRLALAPLLAGRVELPEVALDSADLLLHRDAQGRKNWVFGGEDDGGGGPAIGTLALSDAKLRYLDPSLAIDIRLRLDSPPAAPQAPAGLRVTGEGRLRGEPFRLTGSAGSLLGLRQAGAPYRLDLEASAGATRASFAGSVVPWDFRRIDGRLALRGPDLSKLYPIVPVPLPWTPEYGLEGRLAREDATWSYTGIAGTVGKSDLAGDLRVEGAGERPKIVADVTSRRLDYRDLGGFVGLPPGGAEEPKPTAAQRREQAEQARRKASGDVLPDEPYALEKLRRVDADVRFRGERVRARAIPLERLDVHLRLDDGRLRLQPLDFGLAGGRVRTVLALDARADPPPAHAELDLRNLELGRLFPKIAPPHGSAGRFGGRARLDSRGRSVAQLLAGLDGEASLIMTGGQASTLTLFLTNLDLANAVPLLVSDRAERSRIRCVFADLEAQDGRVRLKSLIADTETVQVVGQGTIDLARERYDLRLTADSKRASVVALRGPMLVTGSFADPEVRPEATQPAARAAGAVALGALLTPLAALLPLIDPGDAPDADCNAFVKSYRVEAEAAKAG